MDGIEPRRWRRGSYIQPAFTKGDVRLLILATLVQVSGRIYDYLTPPKVTSDISSWNSALEMAEAVYPLRVWGTYFLIAALFLVVGLWQRRHVVVWLGHSLLTLGYVMLFLALLVPTVLYTPLDNYRTFTTLITPTILQGLLMLRTGPKPICITRMKPKEVVGGEGA